MKQQAVLSLSGGMDSSTLLLHLLAQGNEVTALSFDYGQKHSVELERAKDLVDYINNMIDNDDFSKTINHPCRIKYQVIKLDGLSQLLNSALVTGGDEVPEGHYAEENMKATVVPNRNKIFSSIIQSVALSIANEKQTNVEIAMGIHAGDHAIYPDCRQEFRDIDYDAFCAGNWDVDRVRYYTPYLNDDKTGILKEFNSLVLTKGYNGDFWKKINATIDNGSGCDVVVAQNEPFFGDCPTNRYYTLMCPFFIKNFFNLFFSLSK